MKYFLLMLTAASLYGQSLSSLIESAQHNENILSLDQKASAAALNHQATKNSYMPRVDAFANGSMVDRTGGFDAKRSGAAGLKAEMIIFDGFKRENTINQSDAFKNAASYDLLAGKKGLTLEVIQRYFELQNTLDEMDTNTLMRDQLSVQLNRLEKFRSAGLASEDSVMRMHSELSNAQYVLEDLQYQADRQKGDLEIISNQKISNLDIALIVAPTLSKTEELDSLKALRFARDAKRFEAEKTDAGFLPTIKIEDQYTYYDYYNDPIASMRVDSQNKLTASLTMNLIDFSSDSTAKQALEAQAQAKTSELAYASKEAQNNLHMAIRSMERSRILIDASQSAFDASQKTFDAVKQKYEARIVDYITYLDALHSLTNATNQLTRAKRSLLYAYAAYYYYAGFDPKEFVQ
ncbi:MAG TPA: TolC family protein [Sulfuricurvum sp.]|nr:TolC family protein [Sulfuricurvum sp.]